MRGQWQSQAITICNIYAPNVRQIHFLSKVLARLFKSPSECLIVGGDFNLAHLVGLDRHVINPTAPQDRAARDSKLFRQLTRRYALFDTWRALHVGDRQYTFFSAPHRMHSRLDYFFVNNATLRITKTAQILPISWSDHAPITLSLEMGVAVRKPSNWQLNNFLLQHVPSRSELETTLKNYFSDNNTPDISLTTLWEAHKAVFRGRCIALSSAMKRNAIATKLQTEKELKILELRLQTSPSISLLKKVVCLRNTLRDLALGQVEKALLRLKQTYYDKGNKAHSLLARKLSERSHMSAPHQIKDRSDTLRTHPQDIAQTFGEFYTTLYNNPEIPHDPLPPDLKERMRHYLEDSGLPRLQRTDLDSLNVPITEEEVIATIKTLPTHKSPGPDGLPYEYYKTFLPILLPYMCKIFNAFFQNTTIPADMQRSFLTLIPKPDKDPSVCASYRPIALLNSDLKIFTKLLSMRLNLILPSLIHKDQVGFVPLRQAGDNTRRIIDLIDVANREGTNALVLGLDAEKAFDSLGWPFLFATLHYMGFRGPFLQAIRHLYTNPSSQVKTPFALSQTFPIANGTRQGCPLSPLLFALCVEPLAATIRKNTNIHGIQVRDREFKLALFADDIILTLTQPRISLPNLQAELDLYRSLSGYKINATKSEALPINIPAQEIQHLQQCFPYHWNDLSLKYLGIQITSSYSTLYRANYPPLLKNIRDLLRKWKTHHISLLGRIASVKMVILPKLLYLFQTLPIPVPSAELQKIQADMIRYIWNYKRHRIPRSVLLASRTDGGLSFPDITKYYQAAQLRALASWFTQRSYNKWTEIEKLWMAPVHPNSMLWNAKAKVDPSQLLGPMLHLNTLWRRLSRAHTLCSERSLLTSFLYNPKMPAGLTHQMSSPWATRNLFHFGHLVHPCNRRLLSFAELQKKFGIPKQAFYGYLQLRHYAQSIAPDLQFSTPTTFEGLILEGST